MRTLTTRALAAGLSFALLAAPMAMAQDDHQHGDQHGAPAAAPGRQAMQPDQPAAPAGHGPAMPAHPAGPAHEEAHGPESPVAPGRPAAHGAQAHSWHSGARYKGGRNVVDYNRYHLRRPPHGYEWVRDGNQFVLIAISSGIIASVLAANGY